MSSQHDKTAMIIAAMMIAIPGIKINVTTTGAAASHKLMESVKKHLDSHNFIPREKQHQEQKEDGQ